MIHPHTNVQKSPHDFSGLLLMAAKADGKPLAHEKNHPSSFRFLKKTKMMFPSFGIFNGWVPGLFHVSNSLCDESRPYQPK